MVWSKETLWSKADLYTERALLHEQGSELFLFWYSLAFEFLLRAAVAHVSPALLAGNDWRNTLYAVKGTLLPKHRATSKPTKEVLEICKALIPDVDNDVWSFCETLIHKRNEELHSGVSSFSSLEDLDEWLVKYYRACSHLITFQERTLVDLFGKIAGAYAAELIAAHASKVRKDVLDRVSAHKRSFAALEQTEVESLKKQTAVRHTTLRTRNHHQVTCPACGLPALISGDSFVSFEPELTWDSVIEREEAVARKFECLHCGLRLAGLEELLAARVPTKYVRTITRDPSDYFGIEPEVVYLDRDEGEEGSYREYDNE